MIRVTTLDSKSEELELRYTRSGPSSTDKITITNVHGKDVAVLELFTHKDGVGKFRLTNAVHALPFGRYVGTLVSGTCCCGCFDIEIPKCGIEDIGVNDIQNELKCSTDVRPERECATKKCEACCQECCCTECDGCKDCNPCDYCNPCYTDHPDLPTGEIPEIEIIYSDEAREALGL